MSGPDPEPLRREALRWLDRVEDDLEMVAAAMERGRPLPAAFHAHQAAEKLLKVLPVLAGVVVPRTHDLDRLVHLTGAAALLPEAAADRLAALTPWATIGRYPEPEEDVAPTLAEIAEARALLDVLDQVVRARLAG